jgi:hypothetical protein
VVAATTPKGRESKPVLWLRGSLVALELDDLAASGLDLHLDFLPARVNAFDLPDAVVELDLLDLQMPLAKAIPRTSSMFTGWAEAGAASARLRARKAGIVRIESTFSLDYLRKLMIDRMNAAWARPFRRPS